MIKAVILDLDGTIVDFNLDYELMRLEVVQLLTKLGCPSSIFSINESIFNILKKAEIYIRNNNRRELDLAKVKEKVFAVASLRELEAAHTTNLLPGILDTLKALRRMKLKTAIFTVNSEKSTSYILRYFRLERFFDAIITREFVSAVKPDPAHLKAVLKALNVEPEEAIVAGDSEWDIRCAKELNVLAVGITTGVSSPQKLIRAGADYVVSSSTSLLSLIQRLSRQA